MEYCLNNDAAFSLAEESVVMLSATDNVSFKMCSETRTLEYFLLLQPTQTVIENIILFRNLPCLSVAVNSDSITTDAIRV